MESSSNKGIIIQGGSLTAEQLAVGENARVEKVISNKEKEFERIPLGFSSKVFISYRRQDTPHIVDRIYKALTPYLGAENIFRDKNSIPLSTNFVEQIEHSLSFNPVVLVIIGKNWATGFDRERDYVRMEIELSLERALPIIPIFVNGAEMPGSDILPSLMSGFTLLNGIEIRPDPDFEVDIERLVDSIQSLGNT